MRTSHLVATICLVASPVAASPKTFEVEGKKVSVEVEQLKPAVEVTASATSKVPAVATYLDYMRALAAGDIPKAAALTQAPEKTKAQQQAYMERLGGSDAFKARYASALTAKLKLTHLVTKGDAILVLGEHPEQGAFANFVICKNAKCAVSNDTELPAVAELASLFGAIREGNIKL